MKSKGKYTAWVIMDEDRIVGGEHETSGAAVTEMIESGFTREEMLKNRFTLNKVLCEEGCWIECLEEIEY